MGEEGPVGVAEQLVVWDHGETDEDAGRDIHIEGEVVDVVCGAPALAIFQVWVAGFRFLRNCPKEKDWRDCLCLSVFLTPLDLRNVSFQIFIPH